MKMLPFTLFTTAAFLFASSLATPISSGKLLLDLGAAFGGC